VLTGAVGDCGLDELDGFLSIVGLRDSLDDEVGEQHWHSRKPRCVNPA
jgi:hypothetical protein